MINEVMIVDLEIDPTKPRYENTSLEVTLLRKDLLINLIDRGVSHGYHDLMRHVFPAHDPRRGPAGGGIRV